jgi:hypothetical protein
VWSCRRRQRSEQWLVALHLASCACPCAFWFSGSNVCFRAHNALVLHPRSTVSTSAGGPVQMSVYKKNESKLLVDMNCSISDLGVWYHTSAVNTSYNACRDVEREGSPVFSFLATAATATDIQGTADCSASFSYRMFKLRRSRCEDTTKLTCS